MSLSRNGFLVRLSSKSCAGVVMLLAAAAASAQSPAKVALEKGESKIVPCAPRRVAVGNPSIATAESTDAGVKLTGISDGRTTVLIWDAKQLRRAIEVVVGSAPPVAAATVLPNSNIHRRLSLRLRLNEKALLALPPVSRMVMSQGVMSTADANNRDGGVEVHAVGTGHTTLGWWHTDGSRSTIDLIVVE